MKQEFTMKAKLMEITVNDGLEEEMQGILSSEFGIEIKSLKARGIFNKCADSKMIQGEKGAWERAVVEKYAEDNS